MSVSPVLYSSERMDWETPADLFRELDAEFGFQLDAAATAANAKCARYLTPELDALRCSWRPSPVWLNPPYGRGVGAWVAKAYEESLDGSTVVCLLPSRTDTRWFHDFAQPHAEIRFLRGRLRFVGARDAAPFPSLIAIFRGGAA